MTQADDDELLKAVALRNASSILRARNRVEDDLIQARDALERKTQELARSLAMMKATLESATDGILVTDNRYGVTSCNEKFLRLWEMPPAALEPGDHHALLASVARFFEDPAAVSQRVAEIYRLAPPATFDVLKLVDGRVIERQSRPQIVEGATVGRVWSFRDISEQRRAEEALRDESRLLELLNRTGQALALQLDLHAVVQAVTNAGTQITGAQVGAFFSNVDNEAGESLLLYTLSGAPLEAFERFGQSRATSLFGPTLRGEGPIRSDDIASDPRHGRLGPSHGMPTGQPPVRSYLAVPVISRSGGVIGGLFFGHSDPGRFTERSERIMVGVAAQAAVAIDNACMYEAAQHAAEERKRLLESEREARGLAERMGELKDQFLATLSHELRTPLSAIVGWVHILRRSGDKPLDLRKGLDTIERNSRLQIQLIEDLLDMNRIASGKIRLDMQPVEPLLFIEAALETVRPAAEAKGVQISCRLDHSVGTIPGDPARLQQVMGNLLSNALKFTPASGSIEVMLQGAADHVEIGVTDSGIGIQPDFVAHVFERFRQADPTTTRRFGGLGLGLSIVRNLVELHHGSVSVASAGEGRGATFTVRLPQAPVRASAGNAPALPVLLARDEVAADLSGITVLLVDDDPDGLELASRVLRETNAQVLTAAGAAQALELIELHRPDVLVSDIGMPDVDGFMLLRQVRERGAARGGSVPAIALTAFARPEDRTQSMEAGFVSHLTKPFDPADLVGAVCSAAGRVPELEPVQGPGWTTSAESMARIRSST